MKRALSIFMFVLLLVSTLTFTFNAQNVKASGTIYIRADGSIDPPTAPIQRDGDAYTLTGNITSDADGIVIERDDMTLDGDGYMLQGTGAYLSKGVDLSGRINVTLGNIETRAFYYGIYLNGSSSCSILESRIAGNHWYDLRLVNSSNNMIVGNNVTDSDYGIYLSASPNNMLQSNRMSNNTYNFLVDGWSLSHFLNDIDVSNTVNSRPVYYWVNQTDTSIPTDAGYVAVVNCTRISIRSLNLSENGQGVLLAYTENSTVAGNCIASTDYGITLLESFGNTVENNTVECRNGIWLVRNSSSNSIFGNVVENGGRGVFLYDSSANKIYHNSFANNTIQVQDARSVDPDVPQSTNIWDDGYPSGGNYWSGYTGADVLSGEYQNETGSDGIGDTPYVIDSDNQDRYPIVHRDVAVLNVVSSKTVVGQNYSMNVSVAVENQGDYPETFNVTVYASADLIRFIIGSENVTLPASNYATITFTWNTSGFFKGYYTISAIADTVPGETSTADNNFTGGEVFVSIVGDLTGGSANPWDFVPDWKVSGADISVVARCFGSSPETQPPMRWEPNCDINNNGRVDGTDVATVARHFGEADP